MKVVFVVLSMVFSMSLYADEVNNELNEYINSEHNHNENLNKNINEIETEADAEAESHAKADAEVNFYPHSNTEVNSNTDVSTTVNAEPAYAPSQSFNVSNQTCLAGVGGSLGVGGVFSGGYAGTHEDEQCTFRANLNHITALYGREVGRAYAEKYLVGLDEILNGNDDESVDLKVVQPDKVVSEIQKFTASRM